MATSVLIPIRCKQCGRLYHVPPSSLERRAKCKPCGHQFELPRAQTEPTDGRRKIPAHQSAPRDRFVASQIAAMTAVPFDQRTRRKRQLMAVGGTIAALGLLLAIVGLVNRRQSAEAAKFQRGHFVRLSEPHDGTKFRSVVELVEAIEPSVVQIETAIGMGSGFVVDESGLVVTCHHCVRDTVDGWVTFADGRREKVVRVRGAWPEHDIAIVEITTLTPVVPLSLETRALKKGEPVVAFGAPEGLSFSISEGSVSALRTGKEVAEILVRPPYNVTRGTDILDLAANAAVVQITAAIMPGSSGGPVVNFSGNVVGIAAFGLRHDGQQFGFCIAAEDIRRALEPPEDDF
jgi:S1-C subfamily serine protease